MKNYITLLFLIAAIGVNAQTKVKSKNALGDSIILQKSAFEIAPIIVRAEGDTARSMSYYFSAISRDTAAVFNATIIFYDKAGAGISTINQVIPGVTFAKWALFINRMDTYILNQRKRLVKQ